MGKNGEVGVHKVSTVTRLSVENRQTGTIVPIHKNYPRKFPYL